MAKKTKPAPTKVRSITDIKTEIEKLQKELKEKTSLKPFTINVDITITPNWDQYSSEYRGTIDQITCKEHPDLDSNLYEHATSYQDEVCRDFIVSYFGDSLVEEAEKTERKLNNDDDDDC